MLRSRFFWFVVGCLVGPLLLAADSRYGKDGLDLVSQLRTSASTLATTAGRGSQELGEIAAEN